MTNTSPSGADFLAVLDQHPALHLFGYGPARGMGVDVALEHQALAQPFALAQAADAWQWIADRLEPSPADRRRPLTTYTAKHVLQAETGRYVLQGPFILAALAAGITLDLSKYNPVMSATTRPHQDDPHPHKEPRR